MSKSKHDVKVRILAAMAKLPAGYAPTGSYDTSFVEAWLKRLPADQRDAGLTFYEALCASEPYNSLGTAWEPKANQLIAALSGGAGAGKGQVGMSPKELAEATLQAKEAEKAEQEATAEAFEAETMGEDASGSGFLPSEEKLPSSEPVVVGDSEDWNG